MKSHSILILVIIAFLASAAAEAKYSGGTGEPNDPYQIATAEDLNDIGNYQEDWSTHFILVNDVNLAAYTGTQFKIIGNSTTKFTGVFDGNDNKVWSFIYTSNGIHRVGLFGCVGTNGQIKNLGMENVDVNDVNGNYVAGLVGFNQGTITNCYSTGSVKGNQDVGGLVGINWDGSITDCNSTANISGRYDIGGLTGYNGETITNCYSAGNVTGDDDIGGLVGYNPGTITDSNSNAVISGKNYVGGLAGENDYGTITNCYSTGSVSATGDSVGGLVGYNYYGTISACDSAGSVTGNSYVGGLVGNNYNGTITNCYSTGSVTGSQSYVGGLVGGIDYGGTITNCYSIGSVTGNFGVGVGGLVGFNSGATMTSCYSTGNVSGNSYVGGLVGLNYSMITNCYSTGSVSGNSYVGGLVGYNVYGTITSCYSTSSITGTYDYVGGLAGFSYNTIITSCYATGTVMGRDRVGGLVGGGNSYGTITNCYSIGSVTGNSYVGGLVGENYNGTITNCYSTGSVTGNSFVGGLTGSGGATNSFWDVETSGQSKSGGGTGKLTDEMKTKSTFTNAGWDFVNIWDICEATNYPRLRWQIPVGDFVCPYGVDFVDFAVLASAWQSDPNQPNWMPACDISDPNDNFIDEQDLAVFCESWLEGI